VIKNGVLLKCKKDWNENLSILDLPDISKTKSKLPSYSFPKSKKRGGIDEKQNRKWKKKIITCVTVSYFLIIINYIYTF
jgi:hypothetical protein